MPFLLFHKLLSSSVYLFSLRFRQFSSLYILFSLPLFSFLLSLSVFFRILFSLSYSHISTSLVRSYRHASVRSPIFLLIFFPSVFLSFLHSSLLFKPSICSIYYISVLGVSFLPYPLSSYMPLFFSLLYLFEVPFSFPIVLSSLNLCYLCSLPYSHISLGIAFSLVFLLSPRSCFLSPIDIYFTGHLPPFSLVFLTSPSKPSPCSPYRKKVLKEKKQLPLSPFPSLCIPPPLPSIRLILYSINLDAPSSHLALPAFPRFSQPLPASISLSQFQFSPILSQALRSTPSPLMFPPASSSFFPSLT